MSNLCFIWYIAFVAFYHNLFFLLSIIVWYCTTFPHSHIEKGKRDWFRPVFNWFSTLVVYVPSYLVDKRWIGQNNKVEKSKTSSLPYRARQHSTAHTAWWLKWFPKFYSRYLLLDVSVRTWHELCFWTLKMTVHTCNMMDKSTGVRCFMSKSESESEKEIVFMSECLCLWPLCVQLQHWSVHHIYAFREPSSAYIVHSADSCCFNLDEEKSCVKYHQCEEMQIITLNGRRRRDRKPYF